MSNGQQYLLQETINDRLFVPLSKFFIGDNPNFEELAYVISEKGLPRRFLRTIEQYRGFVLEAYVKWALDRFPDATGINLKQAAFTPENLRRGYMCETDNWGTVTIYDSRARTMAELDGLYNYHENGSIILLCFEITFRKESALNFGRKRDALEKSYGVSPIFCKVRPIKEDEDPKSLGVHRKTEDYERFKRSEPRLTNHRELVIPNKEGFDQLAATLFARA